MKSAKIPFSLILLISSLPFSLFGETFHFGLEKGDQYSIESVTVEDVYINGTYLQSGRLTGKVSIDVEDGQDGWTQNRGEFYLLEEVSQGREQIFQISNQETVVFRRDSLGNMEVGKEYLSPVMRNMPLFPDGDLEPGDTWEARGEEVHDLSRNYDVLEIRFPIDVNYTYLGQVDYDGGTYDHFEMVYDIFHNNAPEYAMGLFYPARVRGRSERTMLWDREKGLPYQISEDFTIIFDMADGQEVVYSGTRSAVYTPHDNLTEEEAQKVDEALSELDDTDVALADEGIKITLHNIHFDPNSPELREEEKIRLREIAKVLNYYGDRDLLITGHAADVGDWDTGVTLSEDRAANTAAFLRELLENPDRLIMTKGLGAAEPVDTNSTEAGRVKNRRVEITILEN
ncbi:MAG: OmpA family protein [Spirochaetales bacterium]|nr:OmpA family protein [Spirochaetales bacterium]